MWIGKMRICLKLHIVRYIWSSETLPVSHTGSLIGLKTNQSLNYKKYMLGYASWLGKVSFKHLRWVRAPYPVQNMWMWWNGRHAWFRSRYQKWCMGSTPFICTNLWRGSSVVEHLVEAQGVSGPTPLLSTKCGSSSVGRAGDWRSPCRRFDSVLPHNNMRLCWNW